MTGVLTFSTFVETVKKKRNSVLSGKRNIRKQYYLHISYRLRLGQIKFSSHRDVKKIIELSSVFLEINHSSYIKTH